MIGVECRFTSEGRIEVNRIQIDGRWLVIVQGRQWIDRGGLHVLVMAQGVAAQELILQADTMTWQMRPVGPPAQQIV